LVAALYAADDDRLNDAVGADGARELFDLSLVYRGARLELVWAQQIRVHVECAFAACRHRGVGNKCRESASKRRSFVSHGVAPLVSPHRAPAPRARARGTPRRRAISRRT